MNDLSDKLAEYLFSQSETPQVSVEVFKYSSQVMLEMLSGIMASIIMAVCLNMKLECLVFLTIFSVLRSYAGGVHLGKFIHCFMFSTVITVIVLMSVKYCNVPASVSGIMMGGSIIILWKTPASVNENRAVTAEESAHFKARLKQAALVVVVIFGILLAYGNERYAFLVSLTAAVTTLLMIIGKWKDEYKRQRSE